MNPFLFLAAAIAHGPAVTPALLKLYADVAHGEGGLAKIVAAINDLAAVANAAVTGETPAPPAAAAQ
jgi:hypothetical protein